jgi:hypothetical protein
MTETPRFVVLSVSRDPDYSGATVHHTLEEVRAALRDMLLDPENTPPPSAELTGRVERFLEQLDPDLVCSVEGERSWNEWVYVAPIAPAKVA